MAESIQEKRARRRKRRKEAREGDETEKGASEKKGYATPSRRKGETNIESQDNALVRPFRGIIDYFEGVRGELEKVTWPTQEETTRLSYIVAAVTVVSSLFLGGLALIFTQLFNVGVDNPSLFIGAFVAFLVVLFFYARYSARTRTEL